MSKLMRNYTIALIVAGFLASLMFAHSCSKMSEAMSIVSECTTACAEKGHEAASFDPCICNTSTSVELAN